MDVTAAEKKKADRARMILFVCMAVGIGAPVILFLIFHFA